MAHTFTLLLIHVVFSTKERRPWLDPAVRTNAFAHLGGIARETGAAALAINGAEDHAHLLLSHPPTLALAKLVRLLKTNSSLWLHRTHPKTHAGFAWQTGYGAFSVSHSTKDAVAEYIARQEEHHQRMSLPRNTLRCSKSTVSPTTNASCWISESKHLFLRPCPGLAENTSLPTACAVG